MLGFVGLGIMGRLMAIHLLKNVGELLVYDIDESAVMAVTLEGAQASTPKEIGARCNIVFLMLPSGDIVREVLFADDGIAANMSRGGIIVDMTSASPSESKEFADLLLEKDILYVDAPVSGGETGALNATLSFMVGAEQTAFEKVLPYFQFMGSSIQHMGSVGTGTGTKLINQVIVNANIAIVSEAFVLGIKIGIDPEKAYRAIRGGLAGSAVLDAKIPLIVNREFKPGGKIAINMKDINNVLATAEQYNVPMPLTSQIHEIMQTLKVYGLLEEDHCAIVKYYEMLANVRVKKQEEIPE